MSARDILLPDRAFEGTLAAIERRLAALELRAQWPSIVEGSTVFPFMPSAVVAFQDWSSPSYPEGSPPGYPTGWAGGTALTVDPGRWILMVTVQMYVQVTGGSGVEAGLVLRGVSNGVVLEERRQVSRRSEADVSNRVILTLATEVRSPDPIDLVAYVFAGKGPGGIFQLVLVDSLQYTAFPG